MDFVIDFVNVGDGDAIIIWGRVPNHHDVLLFLDGGRSGCGQKVIDHYQQYIKPNLQNQTLKCFVNSHPHEDHINGLIEIVEKLGDELHFGIYNDPIECITQEHKDRIYAAYKKNEDDDINHLYKEFEEIEKLNNLCEKHKIERVPAYADRSIFEGDPIKIVSPYEDFYVNLVQNFTDIDFLKSVKFTKNIGLVPELYEALEPCRIVDEKNDVSPENLTSTIIQLKDSAGRKYFLTADSGVDSFNYALGEGVDFANAEFVQLPHHGSRRNISSEWIRKFSPKMFLASAAGNAKHPRRAVVNCIKRNVPNCNVYSTHKAGTAMSYTTNFDVFPVRGWGSIEPL